MKRKVKKERVFILILATVTVTIAALILINTIINLIINHIKEDEIVISYEYNTKENLTELPPAIINNDNLTFDGDFLYYEDDNYRSILGIDVSSHQTAIDWQKVKAQGIEFVYIRAGFRGYRYGNLNVDSMFYEHFKGAKEAGLKVGVYFFSHALNIEEAIDEAYFLYDIIKDLEIDLEVVYDLEDISNDISRLDFSLAIPYSENAIAFSSKMESLGYNAMIYTNLTWSNDYYDLYRIMNYPIWFAQYNDHIDFEYYTKLWQYTDRATLDGIEQIVDMNIMLVEK